MLCWHNIYSGVAQTFQSIFEWWDITLLLKPISISVCDYICQNDLSNYHRNYQEIIIYIAESAETNLKINNVLGFWIFKTEMYYVKLRNVWFWLSYFWHFVDFLNYVTICKIFNVGYYLYNTHSTVQFELIDHSKWIILCFKQGCIKVIKSGSKEKVTKVVYLKINYVLFNFLFIKEC